ncbi:ABC transporter substrate-binding protein [Halostagnicola bangensis]
MLPSSRRQFLKTGTAATAVGLTGLAGCVGSDEGALQFNFVVPIENLGSLLDIPELQDELEHVGEDYEFEIHQDASTPDTVNALASGEADLGLLTMESFPNAVAADAVPGGISTIAIDMWDAHPDYFAVNVCSLPDSDITEPEDLEGGTVAVNAVGTGVHAVYVKMFDQLGIDHEEDVEFIEQGFPTFIPGLEDGIFDAAIFPGLYSVDARSEGLTEVFTTRDAFQEELRPYPYTFTTATNDAIDEKEEELQAWMDDFRDVIDYIENNRDEVVSLAADHFEIPEETVDQFFLTENDYYRDFEIDFDALQGIVDEMYDLGLTEEEVNMEEHATNEFVS